MECSVSSVGQPEDVLLGIADLDSAVAVVARVTSEFWAAAWESGQTDRNRAIAIRGRNCMPHTLLECCAQGQNQKASQNTPMRTAIRVTKSPPKRNRGREFEEIAVLLPWKREVLMLDYVLFLAPRMIWSSHIAMPTSTISSKGFVHLIVRSRASELNLTHRG